tara:strand:+ start:109 stop:975 length:867 start_codon:yes stop_codon:yes gene_type:complete
MRKIGEINGLRDLGGHSLSGGSTPSPFVGMLDTYINAQVAFSLRRLSVNYTGSLIKVRESIGGLELDIGYDAGNVLDQGALLAHVGSGDGFVTTWYDQSGNVNQDAVQPTASSQFKIVDAGVVNLSSGKPSLLVGENNAQLISTPPITESSERSQFCVLEKKGANRGAYAAIYVQNAADYIQLYVPGSVFNYYNGANVVLTGANFTLNIPQLINTNQGTSIGNAYLDGQNIPVSIGGATGNINAEIILGGFAANGMNGNMSEYINWIGDRSTDRVGIESNINAFYTIY